MIAKIVVRRFKRLADLSLEVTGHVVLAGPNNCGKTSLLQAVAAWSLAFERWRSLGDTKRHGGGYTKAPIARQAFSAVPLRSFPLLWNERRSGESIEIELTYETGIGSWTVCMELLADTTEQIYVRPKPGRPDDLARASLNVVYVPPMTGLVIEEPVYQRPKQDQLLGAGRPGEVLRNLLAQAHESAAVWSALCDSIRRLFGYEMLPPDSTGPHIVAEYIEREGGARLDLASAGSGFQQVVMLLAFLHTRPASVLLVDEPDAHLHVILQDVIYGELQALAAKQRSQLILATHSEVIVDAVPPEDLYVFLGDQPRRVVDVAERERLSSSLGILSQTDIMLAKAADGVLYLEGHTDLAILRELARILNHPAYETFTKRLFWRPTVWEPRSESSGIKASDHYRALGLVRPDLPGLIILDGDDDNRVPETEVVGRGLQRVRWRRYEVESYLVHPESLRRFVESQGRDPDGVSRWFEKTFRTTEPSDFMGDNALVEGFLKSTKARKDVLSPALSAGGVMGLPYTSFHEIAAVMLPGEIHPEVVEKLENIQRAFGIA